MEVPNHMGKQVGKGSEHPNNVNGGSGAARGDAHPTNQHPDVVETPAVTLKEQVDVESSSSNQIKSNQILFKVSNVHLKEKKN